jgi:hypothetical protein
MESVMQLVKFNVDFLEVGRAPFQTLFAQTQSGYNGIESETSLLLIRDAHHQADEAVI